jgi:hypothetical protein
LATLAMSNVFRISQTIGICVGFGPIIFHHSIDFLPLQ